MAVLTILSLIGAIALPSFLLWCIITLYNRKRFRVSALQRHGGWIHIEGLEPIRVSVGARIKTGLFVIRIYQYGKEYRLETRGWGSAMVVVTE